MTTPRDEACSRLLFDHSKHLKNTLKAFQEFFQCFQLLYDALYPDPSKVSLEVAIERWKISQATAENPSLKPNLEKFDEICEDTKSRDEISKFLGMYSSSRLYTDWYMAVPTEKARESTNWNEFVTIMTQYYKPTENITLKHIQFRSNLQRENETFIAFSSCVVLEAKNCNFKCESPQCTAEETAVMDQIIIGSKNSEIRQETLKRL